MPVCCNACLSQRLPIATPTYRYTYLLLAVMHRPYMGHIWAIYKMGRAICRPYMDQCVMVGGACLTDTTPPSLCILFICPYLAYTWLLSLCMATCGLCMTLYTLCIAEKPNISSKMDSRPFSRVTSIRWSRAHSLELCPFTRVTVTSAHQPARPFARVASIHLVDSRPFARLASNPEHAPPPFR